MRKRIVASVTDLATPFWAGIAIAISLLVLPTGVVVSDSTDALASALELPTGAITSWIPIRTPSLR